MLGLKLTESVPHHNSLTRIRDVFGLQVTEQVFAFVVKIATEKN